MANTLQNWWHFAGKLHPVVVHFPIALLLVAAALEFFRRRRGSRQPAGAAVVLLCVGAVSALLAAVLGWSDADTAGHAGSDAWVLSWHRWLGVQTACIAILAAVLAVASSRKQKAFSGYRITLVLSALLVAATGHFGGMLIYGAGYLQEAWANASDGPGGTSGIAATSVTPIDFTHDVQPIFARRCYQCHAGEKVSGELHLDSRDGTLKGGKSGHPAIVPGNAAASELVKLIKGLVAKRSMPPKGGALEPQQIATLEAWINQGAKWSASAPGESWHWAYRPPVRVNPPPVKDANWPRNPIDQFILAKLEAEGLAPSPGAEKLTLLRRVTLDLIGLPPTPAEVADFLADHSPLAYDRAVDRLLNSPHYGERMAQKWLDLARYADTHGYEKDARRIMWPYRDWVIDAFNRDLPFDQFTVDQLAGDLLPDPSVDQLIATGFNRNTQTNEEGGVDAEEFRVDAVIDRTNTTGTVWLGTTIACAQCHNHKNDPIPQEEYYRFLAYFNNDVPDVKPVAPSEVQAAGGMLPVSSMENRAEFARTQHEIADIETALAAADPSRLAGEQQSWEKNQAGVSTAWIPLRVSSAASSGGATLTTSEDGTIQAGGASPESDTYTLELQCNLPRITAIRLDLIPDEALPGKGIGRSPHGNIVVTSFRVTAMPKDTAPQPIVVSKALADFEQARPEAPGNPWTITDALTGDGKIGWAIKPQEHQPHTSIFKLAQPIARQDGSEGVRFRIGLGQDYGGKHTIGRFKLSATADDQPLSAKPISQEINRFLAIAPAERTAVQREQLAQYFRTIAPSLSAQQEKLAVLKSHRAAMIVASAMIMKKADVPRQTHIFERGSFLAPGKPVEPGLPTAIFHPLSATRPNDQPHDRLGLANWLVGSGNPLTARVEVNRIWEQHFGRGLVETSDDFGTQGDYPTHPELLDWLATEFIRQGWSIKAMHRLIVTSATYRQSSDVTRDLLENDPYDKFLARAPRLRVEAETVRDIALSAGGLLSKKIGGPSVFPPQPPGIWTMIYSNDKWEESRGEDRYRRGLYTFSRRTAPYPSMTAFDSTSREVICTRRSRTNTPLQALTTLNDPQFIEAAVGVAARMLRDGGSTDADRAAYGFLLCVGRRPTEKEITTVLDLVKAQRDNYARDATAATKLLGQAPGVKRDGLDERELAAWSLAGNVLLNLDETITRE